VEEDVVNEGLSPQLIEASQALFRAAVSMESVEPDGLPAPRVRCPFYPPSVSAARSCSIFGPPLQLGRVQPEEGDAVGAGGSSTRPVGASQGPAVEVADRIGHDVDTVVTSGVEAAVSLLQEALVRIGDPLAADQVEAAIRRLEQTVGGIDALTGNLGHVTG
jgi:hypothetical protein